jgi:uncharacterized membrane protein
MIGYFLLLRSFGLIRTPDSTMPDTALLIRYFHIGINQRRVKSEPETKIMTSNRLVFSFVIFFVFLYVV